jgi:predicted N-acetyltransferase YhbS
VPRGDGVGNRIGSAARSPDEADLVIALRADPAYRPALELVAEDRDAIVGHVILTAATVDDGGEALALARRASCATRRPRRGLQTVAH